MKSFISLWRSVTSRTTNFDFPSIRSTTSDRWLTPYTLLRCSFLETGFLSFYNSIILNLLYEIFPPCIASGNVYLTGETNADAADYVVRKFVYHLWYLSEKSVKLTFFDKKKTFNTRKTKFGETIKIQDNVHADVQTPASETAKRNTANNATLKETEDESWRGWGHLISPTEGVFNWAGLENLNR